MFYFSWKEKNIPSNAVEIRNMSKNVKMEKSYIKNNKNCQKDNKKHDYNWRKMKGKSVQKSSEKWWIFSLKKAKKSTNKQL